ncbi:MAG: hypothetical protein M5U12_29320 [Verrucomicrobia bacterium]|nr:hypothetical protein [Verrucomicrobiota bacterium]
MIKLGTDTRQVVARSAAERQAQALTDHPNFANVLVTLHDGVPVPKVIDFGIAKATQGRLTYPTFFTASEPFLGAPA